MIAAERARHRSSLGQKDTVGFPTVRTMTTADEVPAIDTVVLAFAADPVARWSWPDSHQYLTNMPSLTRAFGGRAFRTTVLTPRMGTQALPFGFLRA